MDRPNSSDVNPVLVEVIRGGADGLVESFHRGRVAVVSRRGVEMALGDIEAPVFWRSAAKPFQAAAALEAGVKERFELSSEDVALLCSSHNGEDAHRDRAAALLQKCGAVEGDLKCGPHPSISPKVASALASRGERLTPMRSNCSGKHAGMLLFCECLGADKATYTSPDHPVQRRIVEAIAECAEVGATAPAIAIDGCSAPTFALPLANLAIGFRNLATATDGVGRFGASLARCREAMMARPYLVAGTNRIDTDLMTACGGSVVSKIGAEGVMACGVPSLGIGIAIKIDDGSARAYEALILELLARFCAIDASILERLSSYRGSTLHNFAKIETGRMRVRLP